MELKALSLWAFGLSGRMFRVWGLGFGGFGLRVLGLGFRVWGIGFEVFVDVLVEVKRLG